MTLGDLWKRWLALSPRKRIGGGLAAVAVAVAATLMSDFIKATTTPPTVASPRLEILDLSVVGGIAPIPPAIDLTLRNSGDTVSVITGATLTVRDFGVIRICEGAGGSLGSSADYDVQLPAQPVNGDVVEARLSQQILADEADRFSMRLAVPSDALLEGVWLYHLDVGLLHDAGEEALVAGRAIVSIPFLPPALFFSPEGAAKQDDMGACFRSNEDTLKRLVAHDGARPSGLIEELALGDPSFGQVPEVTNPAIASQMPVGDGPAPVVQGLVGTVRMFTDLAESEGLVCSEFEAGIACDSETGEAWLAIITKDGDHVEGMTASGSGSPDGPPDLLPRAASIATGSDEALDWTDLPSPGVASEAQTLNGHDLYLSESNGVWFVIVGEVRR